MRPMAHVLRPSWAALLLAVVVFVGGCTGPATPPSDTPTTAPPPFADCAVLSTTPGGATPAAGGPGPGAPAGSLPPELELPCFTGGEPVALRSLRGPAVVNLWAAWCLPCRKELPAFQRLAERAGDQVHVIGVNTKDDRVAAQTLADDLGVAFPTLYDLDEKLLHALEVPPFLPVTFFIDEAGRIRHIDQSGALDDADLAAALERHLGVVVPL
ncbi:MAG TPA: TlpA disulfide reductase family protein [Micromonosporaceae bacterium]|nr:TlpA disulfide reductase family protein [Micromonosporaceae bacterium]